MGEVVSALQRDGYGTNMIVRPESHIRCGSCGTENAAGDFQVDGLHRLEGASDPDDMAAVVALVCPACGARGTAVLSYGPAASEEDADVLVALDVE